MKPFTFKKSRIIIYSIIVFCFCSIYCIYFYSLNKDSHNVLENKISLKMSEVYSETCPYLIEAIETTKKMATDGFLVSYLAAGDIYEMDSFKKTILRHLVSYYKYNKYDGVYLIVRNNMALYTQDGFSETLKEEKKANVWYDDAFLQNNDFDFTISIDKSLSEKKEPALFVNYKVKDWYGNVLGVIGVYTNVFKFVSKIRDIEYQSNIRIKFIDDKGNVKFSNEYNKSKIINYNLSDADDLFREYFNVLKLNYSKTKKDIIQYEDKKSNKSIRIKYLPQVNLFLVIEYGMDEFYDNFSKNMLLSAIIILLILIVIIYFISRILQMAENKIKRASEEQFRYFQESTRCMFSNIYEIDVTNDSIAKGSIKSQFKILRDDGEKSYSECLKYLADNAIEKDFREAFLGKFSCSNLMTEFARGIKNFNFECPILIKNEYLWTRLDVYIFQIADTNDIHAFIYARDINNEVQIKNQARTDALTQCLTRGATEQRINEQILSFSNDTFAFFILDIDNFKNANDTFGHEFGDYCIRQFSDSIRREFRKDDIIGRFGGDEFVVFVSFPSKEWILEKAQKLVASLDMTCKKDGAVHKISSSIGISLYPQDGTDLTTLYKNADAALYVVKKTGKNNFIFFEDASVCGIDISGDVSGSAPSAE